MSIAKKNITQRTLNALETKNKIFETAIKLFKKYGYDKVTIEDITKQAKVSKGNFYTHFKTLIRSGRYQRPLSAIINELPNTL